MKDLKKQLTTTFKASFSLTSDKELKGKIISDPFVIKKGKGEQLTITFKGKDVVCNNDKELMLYLKGNVKDILLQNRRSKFHKK